MRQLRATPELCPAPTRRAFLCKAAAALPAAALATTLPALAATAPAGNPDAELLAAFEDWKRATIIAETLPEDMTDAERDPCWEVVWNARDRMRDIPARTSEGVAVKLAYLSAALSEELSVYNAVLYGTAPSDDSMRDHRYRMIWDLLADVKRMGVAHG